MTDFSTIPFFDNLCLWLDDEPRTGAMNMAIDQLLMEQVADVPILRVYEWSQPTVSFGYFMSLTSAKTAFSDEGLYYVRRWTGGGIVDHRHDVTYTLVIPRCEPLALMKGAGSYQAIHHGLAEALVSLGENVNIFGSLKPQCNTGDACFVNPVAYDILDAKGEKIAGAGQRRTRQGLLHQGSVSLDVNTEYFMRTLAQQMSERTTMMKPSEDFLQRSQILDNQRYSSADWLEKK